MNTYSIYLGIRYIGTVENPDACFKAIKTIAKATGQTATLVSNMTGEEIFCFEPKKD